MGKKGRNTNVIKEDTVQQTRWKVVVIYSTRLAVWQQERTVQFKESHRLIYWWQKWDLPQSGWGSLHHVN